MGKIKLKDIERLELISIKLEKIPKNKTNAIIEDMRWLTQKLRAIYIIIDGELK